MIFVFYNFKQLTFCGKSLRAWGGYLDKKETYREKHTLAVSKTTPTYKFSRHFNEVARFRHQ